jgi:hypothetical protein
VIVINSTKEEKREKKYTKQNEQQYLISNQETQKHKKPRHITMQHGPHQKHNTEN